MNNADRALAVNCAETALLAVAKSSRLGGGIEDPLTQARDLMADLLHYIAARALLSGDTDPEQAAEYAYERCWRHYEAERPGGEDDTEGEGG